MPRQPIFHGETDPSDWLRLAQEWRNEGRLADALRAHEYYHDNALLVPGSGQFGVRLSFALSYWADLGQLHPAARKALDRRRAEAAAKGLGPPSDRTMFHEALAIDDALGDEQASLELIDAFEAAHPDQFDEFFDHRVQSVLVGRGEYARCLRWMSDPAGLFNRVAGQFVFQGGYSGRGMDPKWACRSFRKEIAELLELLVGAGRTRQAQRYLELARGLYDHAAFDTAIDDARAAVRARRQSPGESPRPSRSTRRK